MRSYHVDAAALATETDPKWVDNLLSHHRIVGVTGRGRGIARRLSMEGAVRVALVRRLVDALGMPVARAVSLADGLAIAPDGRLALPDGVTLVVDVAALRRRIAQRLAEAAEVLVPRRRGRPPAR